MKELFKAVKGGPGSPPLTVRFGPSSAFPFRGTDSPLLSGDVMSELAKFLRERLRNQHQQIYLIQIEEPRFGAKLPGQLGDFVQIFLEGQGALKITGVLSERVVREYSRTINPGTAFERQEPVCDLELFTSYTLTVDPRERIQAEPLQRLVALEAIRPNPLVDEEDLLRELEKLFQIFAHLWEPLPSRGLVLDGLHAVFPRWF